MDRQRQRAREHWAGSGQQAQGAVWLALRDRLGPTVFTGYDETQSTAELLAMVKDGSEVDAAGAGEEVEALFDITPFYAESGGQAGDAGEVSWQGGRAEVVDTQKHAGELHAHRLKILEGRLNLGDRALLVVDAERRARTRLNHSAAHLVHAALKHVLGPHVAQKGQLQRAHCDRPSDPGRSRLAGPVRASPSAESWCPSITPPPARGRVEAIRRDRGTQEASSPRRDRPRRPAGGDAAWRGVQTPPRPPAS